MTNAIATLLFTASYLPGALVLAKTLKQLGLPVDTKLVVLLATRLTDFQYQQLSEEFDEIIEINSINANQNSNELKLLQRPELFQTFSKINVFKLTQFDTLLYLDADTLPIKPINVLFEDFRVINENQIVASPDSGWPDIFNSGVFLIKPSTKIYEDLLFKITNSDNPSFDGADQGLLNEFFQIDSPGERQWVRLPFLYNVTPSIHYQYQPAYQFFESQIKVVHFIGAIKPWNEPGLFGNLRDKWWLKYIEFYGSNLNIERTIHGIEPVYYDPGQFQNPEPLAGVEEPTVQVYEQAQEANAEDEMHGSGVEESFYDQSFSQNISVSQDDNVEILTNPDSYCYFETIQQQSDWNPAYEEPPKNGKPEAEHFPTDLNQYKDWQENAQYNVQEDQIPQDVVEQAFEPEEAKQEKHEEKQEEAYESVSIQPQASWVPPPIFPWERENRRVTATRVFTGAHSDPTSFDESWESLPLLRKIRDRKHQEEEERKLQEARRKNSVAQDVEEAERLKELESFYNKIQGPTANDTNGIIPPTSEKMEEEDDNYILEDDDEPEKSLDQIIQDLHSLQNSELEHSSIEDIDVDEGNGDYDEAEVEDIASQSPLAEDPKSPVPEIESETVDRSQVPDVSSVIDFGDSSIEKDLMEELEV